MRWPAWRHHALLFLGVCAAGTAGCATYSISLTGEPRDEDTQAVVQAARDLAAEFGLVERVVSSQTLTDGSVALARFQTLASPLDAEAGHLDMWILLEPDASIRVRLYDYWNGEETGTTRHFRAAAMKVFSGVLHDVEITTAAVRTLPP